MVRGPEWRLPLSTHGYRCGGTQSAHRAEGGESSVQHRRRRSRDMEVSWLVTGVRHDAFAQANPLVAEVEKPANERGFYVHPALYGQPEEKQIEWGRFPEKMRRLKEKRAAPGETEAVKK